MKENLLHFFWKSKCFGKNISTHDNENIEIHNTGLYNTNAGPDFLNAKLKIGDTMWAGHVEIHIKSSDWKKHNHHKDEKYNPVILHVVYEDDDKDLKYNLNLKTLELKNSISKTMLTRYEQLMNNDSPLACSGFNPSMSRIQWQAWMHTLMSEKMMLKQNEYIQFLDKSHQDWNDLLYIYTARSLGQHVNGLAMQKTFENLPLSVISKHKNSLLQIEAMVFGVAGLLPTEAQDGYSKSLIDEFYFLQKKYNLVSIPTVTWNFLRMRPAIFPTIRLAQMAKLLYQGEYLFSKIIEASTIEEIRNLFEVNLEGYWEQHYTFGKVSDTKTKKIGKSSLDNLLINTIIPLLWTYFSVLQNEDKKEKFLDWLYELKGEKNSKILNFEGIVPKIQNAFESQALIYLYNNYCSAKNCLNCAIGNTLMNEVKK